MTEAPESFTAPPLLPLLVVVAALVAAAVLTLEVGCWAHRC
jgi:hypothetical protein